MPRRLRKALNWDWEIPVTLQIMPNLSWEGLFEKRKKIRIINYVCTKVIHSLRFLPDAIIWATATRPNNTINQGDISWPEGQKRYITTVRTFYKSATITVEGTNTLSPTKVEHEWVHLYSVGFWTRNWKPSSTHPLLIFAHVWIRYTNCFPDQSQQILKI